MPFADWLSPGFLLMIVGLACTAIPLRHVRQVLTIAAPLVGIALLVTAPLGTDKWGISALGLDINLYRVDKLNFVFALAFLFTALLSSVFAMHKDDRLNDGLALAFAGAAISAVTAGDLMSLFIFSELAVLASVFLILKSGTRASYFASMRYLAIQILAGVLMLDGVAYIYKKTGSLDLDAFGSLSEPGAIYIFIALGIRAAFPFLHNWVQDSYPKATVTGAVALSAFCATLSVYGFARLFPGHDELIWIGAIMAVFPVFFAVIENDLRKVLAYALNSQIGVMVCAIGLGTAGVGSQLALNGAAAHAFAHTISQALLFMGMGAVLYRTGTTRVSDLGGLYKYMPWTSLFCILGAASIAAVPFFSGYAAQSMTMSAAASSAGAAIWMMLLFASAGVLLVAGIKVPYFAFFSQETRNRRAQGAVEEAPFNMVLAMGMAAFICVIIGLPAFIPGLGYEWLYGMLPYDGVAVSYGNENLFATGRLVGQMQLIILAAFAFVLLKSFKLYPEDVPGTVLDTDWVYRKPGYGLAKWSHTVWTKVGPAMTASFGKVADLAYKRIEAAFSPSGALSRGPVTGGMAVWTAALLGVVLLLSYITVR